MFAALDSKTMDALIVGAETELHERSKLFTLDLDGSRFASGLREFKADAAASASVAHISSMSDAGGLVDLNQPELPAAEVPEAVLLPLVVNQKGVGLFCVDGDEAGARLLTPPVLNNLKVLRSQAVLAIHQSTLRAAARKR